MRSGSRRSGTVPITVVAKRGYAGPSSLVNIPTNPRRLKRDFESRNLAPTNPGAMRQRLGVSRRAEYFGGISAAFRRHFGLTSASFQRGHKWGPLGPFLERNRVLRHEALQSARRVWRSTMWFR